MSGPHGGTVVSLVDDVTLVTTYGASVEGVTSTSAAQQGLIRAAFHKVQGSRP